MKLWTGNERACRRCAKFDNTREGFARSTDASTSIVRVSSFKLMRLRRAPSPSINDICAMTEGRKRSCKSRRVSELQLEYHRSLYHYSYLSCISIELKSSSRTCFYKDFLSFSYLVPTTSSISIPLSSHLMISIPRIDCKVIVI